MFPSLNIQQNCFYNLSETFYQTDKLHPAEFFDNPSKEKIIPPTPRCACESNQLVDHFANFETILNEDLIMDIRFELSRDEDPNPQRNGNGIRIETQTEELKDKKKKERERFETYSPERQNRSSTSDDEPNPTIPNKVIESTD